MVHDALRHVEEKRIPPEESWLQTLKEASGTAFLGAFLSSLVRSFTHARFSPVSRIRDRT